MANWRIHTVDTGSSRFTNAHY